MISWILFLQIVLLLLICYVLTTAVIGYWFKEKKKS